MCIGRGLACDYSHTATETSRVRVQWFEPQQIHLFVIHADAINPATVQEVSLLITMASAAGSGPVRASKNQPARQR